MTEKETEVAFECFFPNSEQYQIISALVNLCPRFIHYYIFILCYLFFPVCLWFSFDLKLAW